jgi:type IV pilus assembly protein PilN
MIRINLLQERKAKRGDRGQKQLLTGALILGVAAVTVFFFVHVPLAEEVEAERANNDRLKASIKKLTEETKDFDIINQQFQAANAQKEAIKRLNDARAVPAWLLHELSNILTKDHKPTMTRDMEERVKSDHNRQWTQSWDPKRIWMESLEEKDGKFALKGGAQSDTDITQLALRMQASVFFKDVFMEKGETTDDKSKVTFYTFTISGRVVY